MVKVLGVKFFNINGVEIKEGGGSLNQLVVIDFINFDFWFVEVKVEVVCDVDNLLMGVIGVFVVFGF